MTIMKEYAKHSLIKELSVNKINISMAHSKPTPNNKARAKFLKLFNYGYYLRPCKYDNTTIFEICKDLNPVSCSAYRTTHGEVNKTTAVYLKKLFGFVVKNSCEYFGTSETISNWNIRTFIA